MEDEMESMKPECQTFSPHVTAAIQHPTSAIQHSHHQNPPAGSRDYLNPLIAAALVKQHSSSSNMPHIGGTPMIDHPSKELSVK